MINKLKDFWDRFVEIGFYWLIGFIAIFVFFFVSDILDTTDDEYSKYIDAQPPEFFSCIINLRSQFIQFWQNYDENEISLSRVVNFNNLYHAQKEECYKRYNSYFIFSNTMTNNEIMEEVKRLEEYTTPEACLLFEYLPVPVQIQVYKQFLSTDPCN